MTITRSKPVERPTFRYAPPPRLRFGVFQDGEACVVRVTGELDRATRDVFISVATAGAHRSIVVDLGGVTFMDCSGYGALTAARRAAEVDGRSLTITGVVGQPARLFDMIAALEVARSDGSAPPVDEGAGEHQELGGVTRSPPSRSRRTVHLRQRP